LLLIFQENITHAEPEPDAGAGADPGEDQGAGADQGADQRADATLGFDAFAEHGTVATANVPAGARLPLLDPRST